MPPEIGGFQTPAASIAFVPILLSVPYANVPAGAILRLTCSAGLMAAVGAIDPLDTAGLTGIASATLGAGSGAVGFGVLRPFFSAGFPLQPLYTLTFELLAADGVTVLDTAQKTMELEGSGPTWNSLPLFLSPFVAPNGGSFTVPMATSPSQDGDAYVLNDPYGVMEFYPLKFRMPAGYDVTLEGISVVGDVTADGIRTKSFDISPVIDRDPVGTPIPAVTITLPANAVRGAAIVPLLPDLDGSYVVGGDDPIVLGDRPPVAPGYALNLPAAPNPSNPLGLASATDPDGDMFADPVLDLTGVTVSGMVPCRYVAVPGGNEIVTAWPTTQQSAIGNNSTFSIDGETWTVKTSGSYGFVAEAGQIGIVSATGTGTGIFRNRAANTGAFPREWKATVRQDPATGIAGIAFASPSGGDRDNVFLIRVSNATNIRGRARIGGTTQNDWLPEVTLSGNIAIAVGDEIAFRLTKASPSDPASLTGWEFRVNGTLAASGSTLGSNWTQTVEDSWLAYGFMKLSGSSPNNPSAPALAQYGTFTYSYGGAGGTVLTDYPLVAGRVTIPLAELGAVRIRNSGAPWTDSALGVLAVEHRANGLLTVQQITLGNSEAAGGITPALAAQPAPQAITTAAWTPLALPAVTNGVPVTAWRATVSHSDFARAAQDGAFLLTGAPSSLAAPQYLIGTQLTASLTGTRTISYEAAGPTGVWSPAVTYSYNFDVAIAAPTQAPPPSGQVYDGSAPLFIPPGIADTANGMAITQTVVTAVEAGSLTGTGRLGSVSLSGPFPQTIDGNDTALTPPGLPGESDSYIVSFFRRQGDGAATELRTLECLVDIPTGPPVGSVFSSGGDTVAVSDYAMPLDMVAPAEEGTHTLTLSGTYPGTLRYCGSAFSLPHTATVIVTTASYQHSGSSGHTFRAKYTGRRGCRIFIEVTKPQGQAAPIVITKLGWYYRISASATATNQDLLDAVNADATLPFSVTLRGAPTTLVQSRARFNLEKGSAGFLDYLDLDGIDGVTGSFALTLTAVRASDGASGSFTRTLNCDVPADPVFIEEGYPINPYGAEVNLEPETSSFGAATIVRTLPSWVDSIADIGSSTRNGPGSDVGQIFNFTEPAATPTASVKTDPLMLGREQFDMDSISHVIVKMANRAKPTAYRLKANNPGSPLPSGAMHAYPGHRTVWLHRWAFLAGGDFGSLRSVFKVPKLGKYPFSARIVEMPTGDPDPPSGKKLSVMRDGPALQLDDVLSEKDIGFLHWHPGHDAPPGDYGRLGVEITMGPHVLPVSYLDLSVIAQPEYFTGPTERDREDAYKTIFRPSIAEFWGGTSVVTCPWPCYAGTWAGSSGIMFDASTPYATVAVAPGNRYTVDITALVAADQSPEPTVAIIADNPLGVTLAIYGTANPANRPQIRYTYSDTTTETNDHIVPSAITPSSAGAKPDRTQTTMRCGVDGEHCYLQATTKPNPAKTLTKVELIFSVEGSRAATLRFYRLNFLPNALPPPEPAPAIPADERAVKLLEANTPAGWQAPNVDELMTGQGSLFFLQGPWFVSGYVPSENKAQNLRFLLPGRETALSMGSWRFMSSRAVIPAQFREWDFANYTGPFSQGGIGGKDSPGFVGATNKTYTASGGRSPLSRDFTDRSQVFYSNPKTQPPLGHSLDNAELVDSYSYYINNGAGNGAHNGPALRFLFLDKLYWLERSWQASTVPIGGGWTYDGFMATRVNGQIISMAAGLPYFAEPGGGCNIIWFDRYSGGTGTNRVMYSATFMQGAFVCYRGIIHIGRPAVTPDISDFIEPETAEWPPELQAIQSARFPGGGIFELSPGNRTLQSLTMRLTLAPPLSGHGSLIINTFGAQRWPLVDQHGTEIVRARYVDSAWDFRFNGDLTVGTATDNGDGTWRIDLTMAGEKFRGFMTRPDLLNAQPHMGIGRHGAHIRVLAMPVFTPGPPN